MVQSIAGAAPKPSRGFLGPWALTVLWPALGCGGIAATLIRDDLQLEDPVVFFLLGMVTPGTLFEEFGFNYIGPIDGHDLDVLVPTLLNLKKLDGPQFLHVVTRKGKGYVPAEDDPILYHGVSKFDPRAGILSKPPAKPTYTQIFGDWLCDMRKAFNRMKPSASF